ncbi:MAG: nuclear transport factor 2 family protein [Isosphaeraceae bacterium]
MDEPTTEAQKEVRDIVRRINAAWREGKPEQIPELFHDRIVIVGADGQRYGEGKFACADSYRSFCAQATVTHYQESDTQVDVFATTAVVNYAFDIEYAIGGKSSRETGRDTLVLTKQDSRWLVVWRQISAQPK